MALQIISSLLKELGLDRNNGIPDFLREEIFQRIWNSISPVTIMKLSFNLFGRTETIHEIRYLLSLEQLIMIDDLSFLPYHDSYEFWGLLKKSEFERNIFFQECQKLGFLIHPDLNQTFNILVKDGLTFTNCVMIDKKIMLALIGKLDYNVLVSRLSTRPQNQLSEISNSVFYSKEKKHSLIMDFFEKSNLKNIYESRLV